ncbi:flagellar hook-associated protein FlgL [Iodobacter sp. CM08]|uniref:flagellar hook-associated protein FlgL n=1 Tax=Iodobacter sp. CM08 TaxID=3085902 RepID=UPI002981B6E4|nr:flagellar hook-associated protein FlgL [Iodobacter sp. CM08]MDW5417391.1 flagellar hook-associated protein FlgL [Iodobacter sp. CM08]
MRIASTQLQTTLNDSLQTASGNMAELLQKMSSGKRYLLPSEDPISSVRLLRLEREEAAIDQYKSNIGALRSRLSMNESYLDGMTQDLMQARVLLLGADDTVSKEDVKDIAASLVSLRDSLFFTANTKDQEGHYYFSGTASSMPTLTLDGTAAAGSRYTATGNNDQQLVVVGNGVTQASNVALTEMAALLNQLDQSISALQSPPGGGYRAAVELGINGLDIALRSVGSKIANLGGAQNNMQMMEDNHANVSLSNQQSVRLLGSLDYAEAMISMDGYKLALEASQKAYGRISNLSLFDVL